MVRGAMFSVPRKRDRILHFLFQNMDLQDKTVVLISAQTDVTFPKSSKAFFQKDRYDGNRFLQITETDHFALCAKVEIFHKETGQSGFTDILSYEEFLKSPCETLLLLYDCDQIELYTKSSGMIDAFSQRAQKKEVDGFSLLTDENDSRVSMNVM